MTATPAPKLLPMRRKAQLARCPKCRAQVLAGFDDAGFLTHSDPTPITRSAELVYFLAGRRTHYVDNGELVYRDRWRIRRPAPVVFPEHSCGEPTEAAGLAPFPPRRGFLPDAIDPPF